VPAEFSEGDTPNTAALRDGSRSDLDPEEWAQVRTLAVGFVNTLRSAGVVVPVGSVITYVQALAAVGSAARSPRYWVGRATLIQRPEDFDLYERCFRAYWIGKDSLLQQVEPVVETVAVMSDDEDGGDDDAGPNEDDTTDADDIIELRYSAHEVLREKDFAEYTDAELREAARIMERMRIAGTTRPSRRRIRSKQMRGHPDLRRTVRNALRTGGEPVRRAFTQPGEQRRRVVFLLDISGSMESYARALLRFVHASVVARGRVEAFALGTRLTRMTRELSTRDPDRAFDSAAASVADWSGGTRLGESIGRFNDEWGVRGMARGATVVILSDGWDRGAPEVMAEQMARLHRVTHKLIWVNPLKATAGYAPLAQGMAAALPEVDCFIEGHSLSALERLAQEISSDEKGGVPYERDPGRHRDVA